MLNSLSYNSTSRINLDVESQVYPAKIILKLGISKMKRALETSPELRMPDSCLNYQPSTSTWGPQTSSRRLLSSSTIPPLTGPADQDPLFHSKHSLTAHDKYHSLLATWTLLE